jgi:hypothetical protein
MHPYTILVIITVVAITNSAAAALIKSSFPNEQSREWRHCYGEPADSSITVQAAVVTFVQTIHENTPGIKLSIFMNSTESIDTLNSLLLFKFELWHEHTGAKIQYKGEFVELNVVPVNGNETLIEIERPLHVDYDGVYEASLVFYNYKNIEGTDRKEMDEKMCIDLKFKFFYDKDNLKQWTKGYDGNSAEAADINNSQGQIVPVEKETTQRQKDTQTQQDKIEL